MSMLEKISQDPFWGAFLVEVHDIGDLHKEAGMLPGSLARMLYMSFGGKRMAPEGLELFRAAKASPLSGKALARSVTQGFPGTSKRFSGKVRQEVARVLGSRKPGPLYRQLWGAAEAAPETARATGLTQRNIWAMLGGRQRGILTRDTGRSFGLSPDRPVWGPPR